MEGRRIIFRVGTKAWGSSTSLSNDCNISCSKSFRPISRPTRVRPGGHVWRHRPPCQGVNNYRQSVLLVVPHSAIKIRRCWLTTQNSDVVSSCSLKLFACWIRPVVTNKTDDSSWKTADSLLKTDVSFIVKLFWLERIYYFLKLFTGSVLCSWTRNVVS